MDCGFDYWYEISISPHEPVAPRVDFIGKSGSGGYGDFVMETDYQFERLPMINTNNRDGHFAITEGKWKLIMPSGKKGRELYDLTADIGDKNNLIIQHPEVARLLEAKLTDIVRNGHSD